MPDPWTWVFWTAGVLLALGLLVAILLLLLKRQKQRTFVPPLPPHARARIKLEAALLLIHEPRAFAIAVSDAVRVYLEERFQLRAPERTTEEFLRDLQKTSALTAPQKESLGAFLDQCDLMKFARFEPTEAALRELHESALRLVHETQHDLAVTTPPAPPPLPPETACRQRPAGAAEEEARQRDAGGTPPST